MGYLISQSPIGSSFWFYSNGWLVVKKNILKNDGVRQWEGHPIYEMEKYGKIKVMFQTTKMAMCRNTTMFSHPNARSNVT